MEDGDTQVEVAPVEEAAPAEPAAAEPTEPQTEVRVVHGKDKHTLNVGASDTVGLMKEVS